VLSPVAATGATADRARVLAPAGEAGANFGGSVKACAFSYFAKRIDG
jgi:hypothetical protein